MDLKSNVENWKPHYFELAHQTEVITTYLPFLIFSNHLLHSQKVSKMASTTAMTKPWLEHDAIPIPAPRYSPPTDADGKPIFTPVESKVSTYKFIPLPHPSMVERKH